MVCFAYSPVGSRSATRPPTGLPTPVAIVLFVPEPLERLNKSRDVGLSLQSEFLLCSVDENHELRGAVSE
jgi:hypothetical protein